MERKGSIRPPRPKGIGPFTRFALIESNDPINGRVKVKLEGEVTK